MPESETRQGNEDLEGATPFEDEEIEGLIPDHISTHAELNEWEHANIENAEVWAFSRKHPDILSVSFVQELHRRMFDDTWTWAGQFRRSNKNLGVDKLQIPIAVPNACADAAYWVEHSTYPLAEIAARYHHRLVWIHAFPNGNGRHARLSADVFLRSHGLPRLEWGGPALIDSRRSRPDYIAALQAADREDFEPLLVYLNLR